MAWRPGEYLEEGELDNTTAGKVTGWMRFAGMKQRVSFDLAGDFHRDGEEPTLYELGIPICPMDWTVPYDANVLQRVPMNPCRDAVASGYLGS